MTKNLTHSHDEATEALAKVSSAHDETTRVLTMQCEEHRTLCAEVSHKLEESETQLALRVAEYEVLRKATSKQAEEYVGHPPSRQSRPNPHLMAP